MRHAWLFLLSSQYAQPMAKLYYLLTVIFVPYLGLSQTPVGRWKTIDEETQEAMAVVEIAERNNQLYGKIIRLYPRPNEEPDPVCKKCPQNDYRYLKKIIGMEILKDLKKDGREYSGGNVLDPKVGKIYRCRIWLEGETLKVRGYWGIFYRTQTWLRAE